MPPKERTGRGQPKKAGKGGKRGNKGNFHGTRLVFLNDKLPDYLTYVPAGRFEPFWTKFFPEYWKRFPWWLPKNVEPTEENMVFDEEETDAVLVKKEKVIKSTKNVSNFFVRWKSCTYRLLELENLVSLPRQGRSAHQPKPLEGLLQIATRR